MGSNKSPLSRVRRLTRSLALHVGLGLILTSAGSVLAAPLTNLPGARPVGSGKRTGPNGTAAVKPAKPVQWRTDFARATLEGQKLDKLLLVYVCGSGWDDWTEKLDKEVLTTPMFVEWTEKNVVPVKIDYPKEAKSQNAAVKRQNDDFKVKFSIGVVPTFLIIDPAGEILARVGYNTAKLRDEESEGEPKQWLAFCENVLKTRPPPDVLPLDRTLEQAVAISKKSSLPLVLISTHEPTEVLLKERDALIQSPAFARFINRNMVFCYSEWPGELDKSPKSQYFRNFATKWKFGPAPLQMVVWDPGGLGELKTQITAGVGASQMAQLLKRLDALLPRIDYGGGWIDDYKKAIVIARQQQRDVFIAFVSSDASEWSAKMDSEIFQTKEFKDYANKGLVLLKIDFPKATTQPASLKDQNKMLGDMYAIRGYPSIIILNPLGQKVGEAKYMKGGAPIFIKELNDLRMKDKNRRLLPSDIAEGKG